MAPAGGSARQIGGFERHADCHLERTHMKEHKKRSPAEPVAAAGGGGEAEGEGVLGPTPDAPAAATGGAAVVEPPAQAMDRLEEELAALKDKYLRLAAEYDNFRKRTARERTELWGKAQADLIARLVDGFDDLARFAHVDPAQTDAKTIHDGVDLV